MTDRQKWYLSAIIVLVIVLILFFWKKITNFFTETTTETTTKKKKTAPTTEAERLALVAATMGSNNNASTEMALISQISQLQNENASLSSQLDICSESCFDIELTIIKQPSGISTFNGCIGLKVKNGNLPFSYQWKKNGVNSFTTKNPSFIFGAGLWSCTVTDSDNVSITKQIQLDALSDIEFNVSSYSNIAPSSDVSSDGQFQINLIGGLPPYKYKYNTGENSNPLTGMAGFRKSCYMSDSLGNRTSTEGGIQAVNNSLLYFPNFAIDYNSGMNHNSLINSTVKVSGRGKSGETYTFLWNTAQTTSFISNPTAGVYSVEITGNLGSSQTISGIVVTERPLTLINISNSNSSGGLNNGSINVLSIENRLGSNFTFHLYNETTEEYFLNPNALKTGVYKLTAFTDHGEWLVRNGITIL